MPLDVATVQDYSQDCNYNSVNSNESEPMNRPMAMRHKL